MSSERCHQKEKSRIICSRVPFCSMFFTLIPNFASPFFPDPKKSPKLPRCDREAKTIRGDPSENDQQ